MLSASGGHPGKNKPVLEVAFKLKWNCNIELEKDFPVWQTPFILSFK